MRTVFARIAAVIAAGIVTFLSGKLGLDVTEEARVAITEGITMLGMAVWLLLYGIFHKVINRFINPGDVAKPLPQTNALGTPYAYPIRD